MALDLASWETARLLELLESVQRIAAALERMSPPPDVDREGK